ncbi:PKD domain-containing protein [Fluviicola taffensis]|uniref:PKD domain containing protein n=1 Tax=Fluviicola taffensis (strain DSM 16823 / NCIMB 13979 / RW262) TaxID=755732 RepID=F2IID8_FLUTR|nr:PKD domain-containing protein [Fluviicola taffensis]AEA44864.1 PKD domain containing protein [Fluviicola taffensis DSM 16823]
MKNSLLLLTACLLLQSNLFAQCNADAGPDVTVCLGASTVLGGTPAGTGAGTLTYSWSPATGLSCTTCANPTLTATSNQTYTLTVTSSLGCTDDNNVTITVAPPPTASFNFTGNNSCSNIPIQFTNTSTGTGLSYAWNFGDPSSGGQNTSSQTNPTHQFNLVGTGSQNYTVTLVVTNSNGCTSTISQTVTINALPNPALIDPIAEMRNCDGSNFTMTVFDASSTTAISNYTIQWGDGTPDFNSGTFPGGGLSHNYTTAEIFTLDYTVTGNNGCVQTVSYNIANITNPAIGAANPGATTGCGPITLCFPLSNYTSNHNTTFYVVNYGDGSPTDTLSHPPPATICHTYTTSSCGQAGNQFVFRIKAINLCDSSEASISPIRVYTGPQANFNVAAVNNCVGSAVSFINSTQTGFNSACSSNTVFQWNFGDGQTLTTTTATSPTHIYTAPGTYTVTLTTTNTCSVNVITRTVCIESPPTPSFTITPTSACIPFTAQVTDASNLANTCNVTRTWTVLFNGSPCLPASGGFSFVGGTNASSVNPQIQFTQAGNYTVRLTLSNSCGSFVTNQPIVAQKPPQVIINTVPSVCAGLSVSPTASVIDCLEPSDSYLWTFTGGSPNSVATLVPGAISYPTAGTFPISLAVTNACGTTTANASVVIRPIPPVLNPQVNSPVCAGSTANFTSDASASTTYSWTGPNSFTSNQQNFNLTNVTATQAGTYTVFGTMAGCPGPSSSVTLIVNPIPVITVTPPSATICNGQSVSLTASGATSYTWSPATGLSATNTATVTANPTATQTYTIVGSNGTCSGTTTAIITVNPLPIVNAGPNVNLCNQPIPFTLTPTPAGGTWTGPNVTSTGIFTPSGTGSFNLVYSFTNGNGCTNTDTLIVTVTDPIPALAGPDSSKCFGSGTITLIGSPTGGTWSGTSITAAGIFTPNTVGTHALVYTFGTGTCLSRDTMLMTVNPLPIVDAGPNFAVCIDAGIQNLNGTPLGGTWTGIGITNPVGEFTPSVAGTGPKTLTYSFTNVNGCSASDNLIVTVNPLPIVNAGPDTTACDQPNPFQLTASPAGGIWTGTNVSSTGVFTPNGTGNFTLTYTFTNANGCIASDIRIVTVISPTQPNAGVDFAVCIDAPNVSLTPTPTGGTWSGSFTTPAGIFNPTIAGSFNLVYTLGSGACLLRDTLVALVNPLPIVNAGTDFSICIDAGIQNLAGTPTGGTWTGIGITNPTGEFTPSVAGTGAKTITYSFTDINGCTASDNLIITVNPLPVVNAGMDTTLCDQPLPIQFVGLPTGGTWSGTGITPSGLFTPSVVGTFNLIYTFTNGFGCTNSDTRIVTVVSPALANAGTDLEACIDAPTIQLTGMPITGTWTGSFVNASGLFNPTIAGTFPLVISNGAGNCLTSDTMLFTVHPLPIVSVGVDVEFCQSDTPVNFSGNPANGVWSGNGITDASLGTFDPAIAPIATNTIVYTFTNPTTGCINRDTLLATVHPMPVANFTYNPITCIGTNELFTNTSTLANQSDWSFGDGTSSSTSNTNHTYISAGFYDIQLLVTTSFGCLDSISHQIEVRIPPMADFILAPDSACGPMLVSFTDLSLGQSLTYNWNYGNGQTSTNPTPLSQTYQASNFSDTSYTITLNLTNFCGTSSHSEQITVMPSPTAVFGTSTNILCTPLILDMVNNSFGLPDTYEWIFGDGTTSDTSGTTLQHTFYTGTEDTTYTIQLIVSNECGSDTVQHQITVLPPQVNAFFNIDNPMGCVPHTINLNQFSQGASFSSWDFGDGNISSVYNPSHTFTTPGTYIVSLFAAGCGFDTTTTIVTVHPLPQIDFTSLDSVCVNQGFIFNNLSSGIASISWDFGDGTTSTLTNPTHSYSSGGFYTVTLSGISQTYGCTTQTSKTIKVNQGPTSQFTLGPNAGCVDLTVQMTNTSAGITSQAWNFGDGNSSIQTNPTHTFTTPGSYAVQLIVLDNIGCPDTATQVVTVYPLPTVDFTSTPIDPCIQPTVINFTNQSANAAGYLWNFGNGLSSTLTSPSSTYQQVGDYTVSLVATSIHGCVDSIQKTVSSYQLASASFVIPSDSLCVGEEIQLLVNSQFANSISWEMGDGTILTGNSINYSYGSSGNYNIVLIAYGDGGCNDTVATNSSITVLPQPTANFSYSNVEGPEPLSGIVAFTNLSSLADSYSWSFGNGNYSAEENPTEHYDSDGQFEIILIASTIHGCADTAVQNITVDFYYGLFIPNAMSPGHADFEVANFVPKGVGLKTFELLIYDDWGNLIWSTDALDENGRPTGYWDGTYRGVPVQQDAYVWKATATFRNEQVWEGKEYPKGRIKRSGTVTVIR